MTPQILEILTAADVIAVNQDPLGIQGSKVITENNSEVWARPLQDGGAAIVLLNRGTYPEVNISVNWQDIFGNALSIGWQPPVPPNVKVTDLWASQYLGVFSYSYTATVAYHDVKMLRISQPFQ